jgi:crotonobetainyl-CoA:carnitine CoA-transferase CaiB-like acyl-CoA transferase
MNHPLDGVRILELALQYPGPYCTMLLSDLGAEVLKVERPGVGDPARALPPFFRSINRNKKSITLDLKIPTTREVLYRLWELTTRPCKGLTLA